MAVSLQNFKEYCFFSAEGQRELANQRVNIPSDTILQLILDQAQATCLGIIGKATAPDTPTFESSVYWIGNYFLKNRSTVGYKLESKISGIFNETATRPAFKAELHRAVMQKLTGMLAQDRDPTVFMPEVEADDE